MKNPGEVVKHLVHSFCQWKFEGGWYVYITWQFYEKVTFLGWFSLKWPEIKDCWWPPTGTEKMLTLNHLVYTYVYIYIYIYIMYASIFSLHVFQTLKNLHHITTTSPRFGTCMTSIKQGWQESLKMDPFSVSRKKNMSVKIFTYVSTCFGRSVTGKKN